MAGVNVHIGVAIFLSVVNKGWICHFSPICQKINWLPQQLRRATAKFVRLVTYCAAWLLTLTLSGFLFQLSL